MNVKLSEMKELGKWEAEKAHEQLIEQKTKEHKLFVSNLKSQHENEIKQKNKEIEKFVEEFKVYHQ